MIKVFLVMFFCFINLFAQWEKAPDLYLPNLQYKTYDMVFADSLLFVGINKGWAKSSNFGGTWDAHIYSNYGNNYEFAYDGTTLFRLAENALYKSNDLGATWEYISVAGDVSGSRSLEAFGNTVCLVSNYLLNGSPVFKISVTKDHGNNWLEFSPSTGHYNVADVALSNEYAFIGTISNGIIKCSLDGSTCNLANVGLGNLSIITLQRIGNRLFASTWGGLYISDNDAASWRIASAAPPDNYFTRFYSKDNVLFGSSNGGVFVSYDNGDTWQRLTSVGKYNFTTINGKGNVVIAGTEKQGLYISTDLGQSWSVNYVSKKLFVGFFSCGGNILYARASSNEVDGLFRLRENSEQWDSLGMGEHDPVDILVDNTTLYMGGYDGIYKSDDEGNNWTKISSYLFDVQRMIKTSSGWLVASYSSGLQFSKNNMYTWGRLSPGDFTYNPRTELAAEDDLIVMSSTMERRVSSNFGDSWFSTYSFKDITWIKILHNKFFISGTIPGLYRSSDYGATWQLSATDSLYKMIYDFMIYEDKIYLLINSGVYYSADDGETWIKTGEGLPTSTSGRLGITNNYLYANLNSGMYRIKRNEIVSVESQEEITPGSFSLAQNFPNPFNPSTTISFSLPSAQNVTLKVYDILGKEIATLVNEYKQAGSYSINFNAKNLSSGVYLYQIQAGNLIDTKKMILIK